METEQVLDGILRHLRFRKDDKWGKHPNVWMKEILPEGTEINTIKSVRLFQKLHKDGYLTVDGGKDEQHYRYRINLDGELFINSKGYQNQSEKARQDRCIRLIKFSAIIVGVAGVLISVVVGVVNFLDKHSQDKLRNRIELLEERVEYIEGSTTP